MKIQKKKLMFNEDKQVTVVMESSKYYPGTDLSSPQKIADMFDQVFQITDQPEEHFYLLCLDTKCKPLGVFEISHGTINLSFASTRSIFQRALLVGAADIIVAHNHPSGDVNPSRADIKTTEQIKEAGVLMDIPLLDHLIIGKDERMHIYSFKEEGLVL